MSAKQSYLAVAGRIRTGLDEIARVVARVKQIWYAQHSRDDDWYVDATALNLHDFYAGIERVLELIADAVDQAIPAGAEWHQALLAQMSSAITGVRPPVLTPELKARLDRYRGFRHVVRNVYTFNFDVDQVARLVERLPETADMLVVELAEFAAFLEAVAED